MPRRVAEEEDWDDEDQDEAGRDEGPDAEEDEEEPTVPCPYCRREVHEDAVRCPHCEHYLSAEDAPPVRKAGWLIAGAVLCLLIVLLWVFSN
jgi:hypothetical protein